MLGNVCAQRIDLRCVCPAWNCPVEVPVAEIAGFERRVLGKPPGEATLVEDAACYDGDVVRLSDRDQCVQWLAAENVQDGLHRVDEAALDERIALSCRWFGIEMPTAWVLPLCFKACSSSIQYPS